MSPDNHRPDPAKEQHTIRKLGCDQKFVNFLREPVQLPKDFIKIRKFTEI